MLISNDADFAESEKHLKVLHPGLHGTDRGTVQTPRRSRSRLNRAKLVYGVSQPECAEDTHISRVRGVRSPCEVASVEPSPAGLSNRPKTLRGVGVGGVVGTRAGRRRVG
jgi:hypothetical protein